MSGVSKRSVPTHKFGMYEVVIGAVEGFLISARRAVGCHIGVQTGTV